eukprot:TRINITY_DN5408_c0_g1_i1.p1 TRINITY_DN5408_c0_g1~~TRINITY_DN5408_c0_g1_i1.p1  ORF type:complete len:1291 (+),score=352.75 TRINITY_DN5408_c0_g1_i1:103-3975(+)
MKRPISPEPRKGKGGERAAAYFTTVIGGYTSESSQNESELQAGTDFSSSAWQSSSKIYSSSTEDNAELFQNLIGTNRKGERNWNEEFQNLIGTSFTDHERELQRTKQLRTLCEEFAMSAVTTAKIIISELFLDAEDKTIPPITSVVGGVAGGRKYFHEGIFFKIPLDDLDIYGGDEGIIKSAGHELRGLMSLYDCRIKGLHFPLMVLIDYRGWRVLASSLLPLGKNTLVYGSSDGAASIHASSDEMNAKIALVAKKLNLQSEYIWNNSHSQRVQLHTSCDIEGHIGRDNRFYLVDTARLQPPASPQLGVKAAFLTQQLRPEFVKSYRIPLCPDSFSGFALENKPKHNGEIREATDLLEHEVVANVGSKLEADFHAGVLDKEAMLEQLIVEMHRHGMNIRQLGLLRSKIASEELRSYVLTEIIARVVKNELRNQMRNLRSTKETKYLQIFASYLNALYGSSEQSFKFWRDELLPAIQSRYLSSLTEEEQQTDEASVRKLRSSVQFLALFSRLQTLLGFKMRLEDFAQDPKDFFPQFRPLTTKDIELYPILKHIHRIFFEEGTALARMAVAKSSDELFELAGERYKESLLRQPNDYRSLTNWGLTLFMQALAKTKERKILALSQGEAERLFKLAEEKFQSAHEIEPSDYKTLNKWGNCLSHQAQINTDNKNLCLELSEKACDKFAKANALHPKDHETLYNWANSLLLRARLSPSPTELLKSAAEKLRNAHSLQPSSFLILHNWAITLSKLARMNEGQEAEALFQEAFDKYQKAIQLKGTDHEIYFNLANSMYRQACFIRTNLETTLEQWKNLMYAAADNYFKSLKLQCTSFTALNNWTRVLINLAAVEFSNQSTCEPFVDVAQKYLTVLNMLAGSPNVPATFKPLVDFASRTGETNAFAEQLVHILKEFAYSDRQDPSSTPLLKSSSAIPLMKSGNTISRSSSTIGSDDSNDSSSQNHESYPYLAGFADQLKNWMNEKSALQRQELREDDFEILHIIGGGRGSYSRVYKAKKRDTNEIFALKVFRKDLVEDGVQISHPFITQLQNSFFDDKRAYYVYDYVSGGDFAQYLTQEKTLSEERTSFYVAEIVLALEYLHSKGFIYRQLRPQKVLFDEEGHVRLIKKVDLKPVDESQHFTPVYEYMAPETLEGRDDGAAVDWWSLGVFTYHVLTGKPPFSASNMNQIIENILSANYHLPSTLSANAKSLISTLLNNDDVLRLEAAGKIKAHPFFAGVNWEKLLQKQVAPPYKPLSERFRGMGSEADIADTIAMPNFKDNFVGFTYVSPSLEHLMKSK